MTGGHPGLSGIMWNRNKGALKNSCSVYPRWDLARSQWKTRQWRGDKIYWLYFYCLWAPRLLAGALSRDLLRAHITPPPVLIACIPWIKKKTQKTPLLPAEEIQVEPQTFLVQRKLVLADWLRVPTSRVRAISRTSVFCLGRSLKVIRRLSSPSSFTKPPAFT